MTTNLYTGLFDCLVRSLFTNIILKKQNEVSSLPVFTQEGTIGLPSARPFVSQSVSQSVSPSVCQSVRLKSGSFDNLKTIIDRRIKLVREYVAICTICSHNTKVATLKVNVTA